jgi:hypothetical protein
MARVPQPKMVERTCANKECRCKFLARAIDVRRGWGKFCSKSCKARKQTRRTGVYGPYSQQDPRSIREMVVSEPRGSFLGSELDIRPGIKDDDTHPFSEDAFN